MNLTQRLHLSLKGATLCVLSAVIGSLGSTAAFSAQLEPTYIRDVQPNFRVDQIPVIRRDTPLFSYSTEGMIEQIKMTASTTNVPSVFIRQKTK